MLSYFLDWALTVTDIRIPSAPPDCFGGGMVCYATSGSSDDNAFVPIVVTVKKYQ